MLNRDGIRHWNWGRLHQILYSDANRATISISRKSGTIASHAVGYATKIVASIATHGATIATHGATKIVATIATHAVGYTCTVNASYTISKSSSSNPSHPRDTVGVASGNTNS